MHRTPTYNTPPLPNLFSLSDREENFELTQTRYAKRVSQMRIHLWNSLLTYLFVP